MDFVLFGSQCDEETYAGGAESWNVAGHHCDGGEEGGDADDRERV